MRVPSASYTRRCCCTMFLPAKAGLTITAWKCWPSPSSSMWSHGSFSVIQPLMSSGVTMLVLPLVSSVSIRERLVSEFVAALQQRQGNRGYCHKAGTCDQQAGPGVGVGLADEGVAEAVDQVEHRVDARDGLPERRQRMDRIEHAGQEGERQDEEVLERRQLVVLLGPDAGDDADRAHDGAGQQRIRQQPERMRQL